MTDADPNDSSQDTDEGMPAEDTDEEEETEEKEKEEDQTQYGGDDSDIDPVEQTERQDGERNDAGESDN